MESREIEGNDLLGMQAALDEARRAGPDVPVGAAVVIDGRVVATASNRVERDGDPTAHAEFLALRAVARDLGSRALQQATLYVTLEPCLMCAGAIVLARVRRVVFGCSDPKAGAVRSLYSVLSDPRLNHTPRVVGGVLADECASLLKGFFAALRHRER